MSYIKNYNVGQTKVDLPYANYIHTLPLLSFGDVQHTVNLSLVFNLQMYANNDFFGIRKGYKINLVKKLIFKDGYADYYQDELGRKIKLSKYDDVYVFDDDSQRILRKDENEYYLENPDYSREKYNSEGYIVAMYDKYDSTTPYMQFTYYASNSIRNIVYKNKKIVFEYNITQMSWIEYFVNDELVCTTYLPYDYDDTHNNVEINHYSGVDYLFTLSDNNLSVESKDHEDEIDAVKEKSECIFGEDITIKYTVDDKVVQTVYDYPVDADSIVGQSCDRANITDDNGVRRRIQFEGRRPSCSYEIGNQDVEFFNTAGNTGYDRYAGTVQIYQANGISEISGRQSYTDGIPMQMIEGYSSNDTRSKWGFPDQVSRAVDGYYILSGWLKLVGNSPETATFKIHAGLNINPVEHSVNVDRAGEWKYFSFKFKYTREYLWVVLDAPTSVFVTKDFKMTFQTTGVLLDEDSSHTNINEYTLQKDSITVDINEENIFYNGSTLIEDKVYAIDILRFFIAQKKNPQITKFYAENGYFPHSISSPEQIKVKCGLQYYPLNSFLLVKQNYLPQGVIKTQTRFNATDCFMITETLCNGDVVAYQKYDSNLDLICRCSDGITTTYTRQNKGLVISVKVEADNNAITTLTAYDEGLNKIISTTDEFNTVTTYTTDDVWGVVTAVTVDGKTVTQELDDDKRALLKTRFASDDSARNTSFLYADGNVSRITHGGIYYTYGYANGDLTRVSKNGSNVETHSYNESSGNTTIVSNYGTHSDTQMFDKYGRLDSVSGMLENTYGIYSYKNSSDSYVVGPDSEGALLARTKDITTGKTTRYLYNDKRQLECAETSNNTNSGVLARENYEYDNLGRVTSDEFIYDVSNSKASKIIYEYQKDETDILADSKVKQTNCYIDGVLKSGTGIGYDSFNRVNEKDYIFDATNLTFFRKLIRYNKTRVSSIIHKKAVPINGDVTNLQESYLHYTHYGYDALGRITYETDSQNGKNAQYEYDEYGQLIRENNKWLDKTFIYEYNGDGNLTSVKTYGYTNNNEELPSSYSEQSYSYNTTHPDRMISFGTASASYNSYGYPTSYKGKALTWSNGRLATVTSGTNVYYYTYNALGQRIKKECRNSGVLNSQTTYSYDNAGRLISEIQTKNIGTTSETGIETIYLYDESGMIGMSRAGTACYFYRNLQGDVTEIYTSGGNSLAKYGYEAYGKCTVLAGTNDYNLANANPIRYRGYYYDTETGFYCLGARYYDPQARRFISPDDTAYIDPQTPNGLNLYCYCGNDPVNFVDPTGHSWESFWSGVGIWFEDHWVELAIGTAFIVGGAIVTALTAGTGVGFMAAFGSALLSSAIQVGISTGVNTLIGGAISVVNGGGFFDNIGDNIAKAYMWAGIFSGGAQIIGGGFRIAANRGVITGRNGGIKLGSSNIKILSPDKNTWTKAGGTLIKFGKHFRIDVGAMWGLHVHILQSGHIPIGAILAGIAGVEY